MSASDLRRVDISEAMRPELAITLAVNRSGNDHTRIAGVAHLADVILRVGGISDQRELHIGLHCLEGLAHQQRVVLRLQPADVEKVLVLIERELPSGHLRSPLSRSPRRKE